jgi:hypothetical protein
MRIPVSTANMSMWLKLSELKLESLAPAPQDSSYRICCT